jgi:two-component system phosphate regulon sensor histidine kinase PhoR
MNSKTYTWILYVITTVIVATICIQVYWNYKNYLVNKQQLINEIQISLDKAVDDYYAALAQNSTVGFTFNSNSEKNIFGKDSTFIKILSSIDSTQNKFKKLDHIKPESIEGVTVFRGAEVKSMDTISLEYARFEDDNATTSFLRNNPDSLQEKAIKFLTSKIVISIKNDSLDLKQVDSLLKNEFQRKNINVTYLMQYNNDKKAQYFRWFQDSFETASKSDSLVKGFNTKANSSFLPPGSELNLYFTNEMPLLLKRISGGILLSSILVLGVIGCLFYLLKIINHQKQLAEIKNDLISNITHEFKTPIATISAALEGMSTFNAIDDKNKSRHYINMSVNQLSKLNTMVEKLLETATLDSNELEFSKEEINLSHLIEASVNSFKNQHLDKTFIVNKDSDLISTEVDVFHFENAINNILDNAVKYGGNTIEVAIKSLKNNIEIDISDNGNSLKNSDKDRIFDKFYRVPKGNTHDVKGFGIGLFYSKTIIEKHGGSIGLHLSEHQTTFRIKLPHEN